MADTPLLPHAEAETIVVPLPAEIDMAHADQVDAELNAAFGPGVGMVVTDMSGTRFCDTSGVHALVMAHKRAQASGTGFRVGWYGPARSAASWEYWAWTRCWRSTRGWTWPCSPGTATRPRSRHP
jgi:STAS domain-containing protein